ncbi:hypothetical protein BSFA1_63500 (plasmid) [Burkholderia sp. SFA1]|uniref:hypothetical protein n=1 Tax=unclassified Caballeronia TaxID=2646786 RepID=UPI001F4087E1|nr:MULTISPECIES: hypothetical protein [unclassified Caballeronia]MCE4545868.1 hypothetical protein [Caballeronia sp. PC1]MCE4572010.1 hypothetical protein [Caballeronia sp. CLC5]BBQ01222.1 hypothetical protein BSFA1_63500 [Burkholderia sp. SFA1]
MKAKYLAAILAAHAVAFAVPAFADECTADMVVGAAAAAPASPGEQTMHAMAAKDARHDMHDMPDVGGADAYKTQSGKHEARDSIDAWLRGG